MNTGITDIAESSINLVGVSLGQVLRNPVHDPQRLRGSRKDTGTGNYDFLPTQSQLVKG